MWVPLDQITPGDAYQLVQAWSPVLLGVAGLLGTAIAVAAASYQRSKMNSQRLDLLEKNHRLRSTDSVSVPVAASLTVPGGGTSTSAMPVAATITYPPWSQLTDRNPDGSLPAARATDCGWECCAYVIRVCRGVEVEADYLRYLSRGPAGAGWSTAAELTACLRHHRFADAQALAQLAGEAVTTAQAELAAGRPVLALGRFLQGDVLHWIALAAVAPAGVSFEDPWTGGRRVLPAADFWARYDGALVAAGERAKYPS